MTEKDEATGFLIENIERLKALPYDVLAAWPSWPSAPEISMPIPSALSRYRFTVMKDDKPEGVVRIAIQAYRSQLGGIYGLMSVHGFNLSPNGTCQPLTQQDEWDLT